MAIRADGTSVDGERAVARFSVTVSDHPVDFAPQTQALAPRSDGDGDATVRVTDAADGAVVLPSAESSWAPAVPWVAPLGAVEPSFKPIGGFAAAGRIGPTAGPPIVTVTDSVVDESAGTVTFTISLDRQATSVVSVQVSTVNGTALAGSDYTALALQTVTFGVGETSRTVTVNLTNDAAAEGGEYFDLKLSNPVGVTLPDTNARVFIGESDQPVEVTPVISVAEAQAGEADGFVEFVVSLSGPSAQQIKVNFQTFNATAAANGDYIASSGTITFEAGQTVKVVKVALGNDAVAEAIEQFYLTLNSPTNAVIGNTSAQASIVDNDATAGTPVFRVGDVVVDEKEGRAYVTVSLDKPSTGLVTVAYATADGTATAAGGDYEAQGLQTLSFAPGQTSKTIVVNLKDDGTAEAGEYFDVKFSAPSGATLADSTARVFIGESDQPAEVAPVISVAEAQAGEGDGFVDFVVSLSGPSAQQVRVNYQTFNATAAANGDYVALSGTITFEAGQTVQVVRVAVGNDAVAEAIEQFYLTLNSPTNAVIGNNLAQATIVDNDATAGTPVFRIGDVVVDEKEGRAYVTVSLDKPSTGSVSLAYATADGSATAAGGDYEAQGLQTLSFAAGQTSKTIVVSLKDDGTAEAGEYFDVKFSAPSGATLADSTARVFIGESDQPVEVTPVISVAEAQAGEGDGFVDFVVSLSGPSAQQVRVNYQSFNATAAANGDYIALSGTLTFEAGQTVQVVRVAIGNDAVAEAIEQFYLTLNSPTNAVIGNTSAQASIVDNDSTAGTPVVRIGDVVVDEKEGRAYVTVNLDKPSTGAVSVAYVTADGSATAAAGDYEAQSTQTLSFAPGQTSKTIVVNLKDDGTAEAGEYFDVKFSAPSGATLADSTARVFIGESDQPVEVTPVISVAEAQAGEGDGFVDFVVSLSGPSAQQVRVNYQTFNGTAAANGDYIALSGTLTFEAGQSVQVVRVAVGNDTVLEPTEQFFMALSSPVNAVVGNSLAQATLVDNDATAGTPVLRVNDVVVDEKEGRAYVTVSLDKPSTGAVSVAYAGASATASAGSDYEFQSTQILSFAPGQTSKTIVVNLREDTVAENAEVFDVVFSSPVGVTLGDTRAHVVVGPSDLPVLVTPAISASAVFVDEGSGYVDFVVTLDGPSAQPVSLNYQTFNGTAAANGDFVTQSGSLTFEAGQTTRTVRVAIGNDTASESAETFTLNLSSPTNATLATPSATATIIDNDSGAPAGITVAGTAAADVLKGLATNDTLNAGAGNDLLDGGAGNDNLNGSTGNDTYLVEQAGDAVAEASGGGTDTVVSYLSAYTLGANVERGVLGHSGVNLTGNSLANTLIGNGGANRLDGSTGADAMTGGSGNDTYVVDNAADTTVEAAGGGADAVESSISWTLAAEVEKLTLTGTGATSATGNSLANTLIGNTGANTLRGGQGADSVTGGLGADSFVFSSTVGSDTVTDFKAVDDTFSFSMAGIRIGDGDTVVEGAATRAAPGGFATSAELVVFTTNIAGAITTASAAAAIGSATGAYAIGADVLFAVDNGTQTGLFLFQSAGADATVSAAELTQLGLVSGDASSTTDYVFIG